MRTRLQNKVFGNQTLKQNKVDLTRRFFLYVEDENGNRKIKYSQPQLLYHYVYSIDKKTEAIEEVAMKMWVDDNKVIHGIAKWKDDKVYIQARGPYDARYKFNKFLEQHFKKTDEKQ